MRRSGGALHFWQVSAPTFLALLACLSLVALLPVPALAAPGAQSRNYIVALSVADAGKAISPSSKNARQRIQRRAARAGAATDRLARAYGFKPRHRYERAITGFSARLTPAEAASLARDSRVDSIRPARVFRLASQTTPRGIQRVKAAPGGGSSPDVDADIAILDTGIGPVGGGELNVVGGINCADDPASGSYDPDDWGDSHFGRHGTHVAGTAAARDNSIGVVGVAAGARLWSVRVFDGAYADETTIVCGLDWAISTRGPAPPPSTQPIEVVNMSIQGPRGSTIEGCDPTDDDLIHVAVCAAKAAGITVVAAAGNSAANANGSSPGGYQQVITVGALSDFDGAGWGEASNDCSGYPKEKDDKYARYSNYGSDVDIVAPGTCVLSTTTRPSGQSEDGKATKLLTGTSMAAPHVSGAVARYLAKHPATTPGKMRQIVRASGRMDWDAKSDPVWSGVSDQDDPNRVLDVGALMGPDDLKVWLSHSGFKLGAGDRNRSTRVDVQRLGGYEGSAVLGLSGLPAGVGTGSFEQASLSGLGGLGTNLDLSVKAKGTEGAYELSVRAQGGGGSPSGSRGLGLIVDRTGPSVSNLGSRPVGGQEPLAPSGAARTYILWQAEDALSTVKQTVVRRKPGSRAWRSVGTTTGSSYKVSLKPGQKNQFKVKVADSLGNITSKTFSARLSVRDSKSTLLARPASGGWKTKSARKAHGGSLLMANTPAESLSTSFSGKAVAVVAPVGPNRGILRIRVDGAEWHEVDLHAVKGAQRRVVFSRRIQDGPHVLEIEGHQGQTAIDAILIIR